MANSSSARGPPRRWVERSGRGTLSLARSSYEPEFTGLDLTMKLNATIPYKSHTLTPKQDRKSLQYYCDIDGDNGEGCPLEETISKAVETAKLILDEQDADRDYYDKVMQAAKEWKERWPNHCTECGGWDSISTQASIPVPPKTVIQTNRSRALHYPMTFVIGAARLKQSWKIPRRA
jgi:hypothetical protein